MNEKLVVELVKAYCRREEAIDREVADHTLHGWRLGKPCYCASCVETNLAIVEFKTALEALVEDVYPGFILKEVQDVTEV